jgi:hypothetical protein
MNLKLLRRIGRMRRPSPAMVVAMVALFVALGGGAAAGIVITGADIQNGSITSVDIKNGTVQGRDIKNNSVLSRDIRNGQLKETDFDELPAARVYPVNRLSPLNPTRVINISDSAETVLEFNRKRFDTANLHDDANPSRLTAPVDGLYQITGDVQWAFPAGIVVTMIKLNGERRIATVWDRGDRYRNATSGFELLPDQFGAQQNPTTLYHLAEGDYVELYVFSLSENRLNGDGRICQSFDVPCAPEFMMHWVSPYDAPDNNNQ